MTRCEELAGAVSSGQLTLHRMSTQAPRPKLRVNCFSVSLDGYGAGPSQDLQNPLGVGGMALPEWFFPTRTFQTMHGGGADGTTGVDEDFAARGAAGLGAWILGRNMFGPVRGAWTDDQWKGWWGKPNVTPSTSLGCSGHGGNSRPLAR